MPGGVLHNRPSGVSDKVKKYLNEFDIRIGTLECAIGDTPDFDPIKMSLKQDVIYAPNINLQKLVELKINCVSLANNHAFDLGANGLKNTIEQLDKLGIAHCGAGMNLKKAITPAIIECKGYKIGVLGICDNQDRTVGYVPVATDQNPGMNSVENDYVEQIHKLRPFVDLLYIVVHWGIEHTFWPEMSMLRIAKKCINAGADGIIGGHQHRIQPIVSFKSRPIFLGLGNFLFPPRFLRPPRPMYYPSENEDTSEFPVTDSYPWVTTPTYKIWKKLGRIGAIGTVEYSCGKQNYNLKIVEMTENHKLVFPNHNPLSSCDFITFNMIKCLLSNVNFQVPFIVVKLIKKALCRGLRMLRA